MLSIGGDHNGGRCGIEKFRHVSGFEVKCVQGAADIEVRTYAVTEKYHSLRATYYTVRERQHFNGAEWKKHIGIEYFQIASAMRSQQYNSILRVADDERQ
jgi:hypothetical protein